MSIVDVETGEVVQQATADQARDLTDRIKVAVEVAWHLIAEAYETRAWAALGYSSWDDYADREFGTARLRLPREERQEVVASLRERGMSVRAIAAVTGDSKSTVQDALPTVQNRTVEPELCGACERPEEKCVCEKFDRTARFDQPTITGVNGKQYKPQATPILKQKDRRPDLSATAQRAGWDFRKSVERLERIAADDRFSANREQVAAALRGHLTYAVEVCQDLLGAFDTGPQEAQ